MCGEEFAEGGQHAGEDEAAAFGAREGAEGDVIELAAGAFAERVVEEFQVVVCEGESDAGLRSRFAGEGEEFDIAEGGVLPAGAEIEGIEGVPMGDVLFGGGCGGDEIAPSGIVLWQGGWAEDAESLVAVFFARRA